MIVNAHLFKAPDFDETEAAWRIKTRTDGPPQVASVFYEIPSLCIYICVYMFVCHVYVYTYLYTTCICMCMCVCIHKHMHR